eukprot:2043681-Prymnesium_polylepis.1
MGLATHWKKLPRTPHSPFLVSYGGDKDFFLEVVPCYVHAVAALQASNAWMMLIAAEVIERSALVTASRAAQNAELVRELQVAAANVTSALVQHSWSTDEMRSTEVCSQALSRADHDRTCACHVAQSTNADIVEGRGDGPPRPRVEIPRTGGVWRALYPDGGSRPVRQVRRTHTYLDAHACPRKYTRVPSQAHTRDTDDNSFERTHIASQLPSHVHQRMARFARDELIVRPSHTHPLDRGPAWQWVRALSLNDTLAADRVTQRPDHGITGAYSAWPAVRACRRTCTCTCTCTCACTCTCICTCTCTCTCTCPCLLAEALATLDRAGGGHGWEGSPTGALALLRGAAVSTWEGPFGQAHELRQPCATNPRCALLPPFKTHRGFTRYVADAGGAFADVIIRSLFGFAPKWEAQAPAELIDEQSAAEWRGIRAELRHVNTVFGPANLSIGRFGVRIQVKRAAVARRVSSQGRLKEACEHPRVTCSVDAEG